MSFKFRSDSDKSACVFALRIAAERYDADASLMNQANQPRLVRQFIEQASVARRIADEIEDNDD